MKLSEALESLAIWWMDDYIYPLPMSPKERQAHLHMIDNNIKLPKLSTAEGDPELFDILLKCETEATLCLLESELQKDEESQMAEEFVEVDG